MALMMILNLDYPVSANRYWRSFNGRMVKSAEANDYQRHVSLVARAYGAEMINGPVKIWVTLMPKLNADGSESKVCIDLDNCLKVALDALQGIAFDNDRQIRRIVATYGDAVAHGGMRVAIASMKD
jgi:crossover junction endodeoxyribonuclease RusA